MHRSTRICLMAEESLVKCQLGSRMMKAVRPAMTSNGVPYLKMWSVDHTHTSETENKGKYRVGSAKHNIFNTFKSQIKYNFPALNKYRNICECIIPRL